MKSIINQLLVLFVCVASLDLAAQTTPALSGHVKCQGQGVPNVVVTNGFDCVLTDAAGKYTMPYHRDARFVYVTTPSGYLPQRDGSQPLFYQRITEGTSNYDFALTKNAKNDNEHCFLVQADVQVGKQQDIDGYSEYLKDEKQFVDQHADSDLFLLDCGDIVGNTLSLFPAYKKASDAVDIPMYRVIGNHDMEYGVRSYEHSYKTYEECFGPIYYSFNRGKAHYIVLDNCYYINRHYRYIGYIDERTLQWIEKDLAFVPKDHLVFVSMHIPTSSTKELKFNALLPDETSNASSLYDLLKGYDAHLLTGHTHNNGNVVFNDSLMEHNTAAVCGTFWKADICTDGTPSGYGVYKVNGNKLTWYYKSAGHPADYQIRAYPLGASEDDSEYILANVWNWDEKWKVEWYENGKCMGEMEHFTGFDPEAKAICSDKKRVEYDWISPVKNEHMFRAMPKDKNAKIEIRVTDRFGQVYNVKL